MGFDQKLYRPLSRRDEDAQDCYNSITVESRGFYSNVSVTTLGLFAFILLLGNIFWAIRFSESTEMIQFSLRATE